ncbi:MAG: Crp/Fnr family transcriptional regulator [Acidobacteriota bacterium]|jgi:CRP/FNR family transcriptional regulator|nr:Crp/Fnr family transcriptional regulator [Acidobacteriota bacterium]
MKVDWIRRIPLFATLDDEEFDHLSRIFVERQYRKNQVIFLEEETGSYMYLVLSGKVKVSKSSKGGKETILAIHSAGDFFGEMALLDGKTAPATVSAMEDAKIISVSGEDFHKYLLHNEKVMLQIIQVLCMRLRQEWQKQIRSGDSADARICAGLQDLVRKHGVRDARGIILDLKITHQELAEMVHTSRETVSRLLASLRKAGIIDVTNRRITVLDEQRLGYQLTPTDTN